MSRSDDVTPLSSHTLDSLCAELLSGRAVRLDDGSTFRLQTQDAVAAFDWYNSNRIKWGRSVAKEDVEAIVGRVGSPPPPPAAPSVVAGASRRRTLFLKSVKARRFGGIHAFGQVDEPPADFCHDFTEVLTLLEGGNGVGKTSVVSAVMWCLTGYIYRPQRAPEQANQPVPVQGGGAAARRVMSPITPLPPREVLEALGDGPLPLDTSVELTFVDDAGAEAGKVFRRVQRGAKDSVVVKEPDFSALGLDPVAREVGTRMPGMIPYLTLGVATDLGVAVAELVGIKPLQEVARHAGRARDKLTDGMRKERSAEIVKIDADFRTAAAALRELIRENPGIGPGLAVPDASDAEIEAPLDSLRASFDRSQAQMLSGAGALLGGGFDYGDREARQGLVDSIGPALGAIDPASLKNLPSAARLAKLARLDGAEVTAAEAVRDRLLQEAEELAGLAGQPDAASRERLYAHVASWLREGSLSVEHCPLCRSGLDGLVDDVTGKKVADHLNEHLDSGKDFLHLTPAAWGSHALSVLSASLHEDLLDETRQDLPQRPGDLIAKVLGDELFQARCFSGCLASLRPAVAGLCRRAVEGMPAFEEPGVPELPEGFGRPGDGGIGDALARLTRALAFARWRKREAAACQVAFALVVGPAADAGAGLVGGDEASPLHSRLSALNELVKGAAPVRDALGRVGAMSDALARRRAVEARLVAYDRAAAALAGLAGLAPLVDNQVGLLMAKLSAETVRWKAVLYAAAFANAPLVTGTSVGGDGSLDFEASARGTTAPAHHVSNASDLRATLLAFLLAFWRHLLRERGGLALFLLDEPQELFDHFNVRRIANALPALAEESGARVVVTTSSHTFGRLLAASAKRLGGGRFRHLRVHPLRAHRPRVALGPFVEAVEEKRRAFEGAENEHQPARDYLKDLRIYLENRLHDFFDTAEPGLPKLPTLSDLMGAVRSRVNAGREAFASAAFVDLVQDRDLAAGSDLLALLNQSHHSGESAISYGDVLRVADACLRVRRLLEGAHEEYELWLRRDTPETPGVMPAPPAAAEVPSRDVQLFADLAAFTSDRGPGHAEPEDGERFSTAALGCHAVYSVLSHNFGFAAPRLSRVIVELSGEPVADNRLVIALHGDKVYARRLLRQASMPGVVVLASEAENPSRRPPTLIVPAAEARLLKVVGILFGEEQYGRRAKGEAVLVPNMSGLGKVEIAFRVQGDSALPLALPGQIVLGGRRVLPNELAALEGALVAVSTSAGAVFKRVGAAVPGRGHARQLESIGGKGESMLARTEEIENDPLSELPLVHSARLIVGVAYE